MSPDLPGQDELPEDELDETRRRGTWDQPPGPDPVADAGLPEHEQDERRVEDSGGQPTNP